MKEQQRKASSETKTNEERFHDLAKPADNNVSEEQTSKGQSRKFYPIVFHNKTEETAELRLL